MRNSVLLAGLAIALTLSCSRTAAPPATYGPVPTADQVEWQKMETNMFIHFGPNTFSGKEWGDGTEPEDMFNPTALDCGQWAKTAKAAGFKGIIITAKHHDGFCLWPSLNSTHSVAKSSWRDGKGDVLAELKEACKTEGLKFGVYISPWDRNDPHYGSPEYNDVFAATLDDVHGKYGPLFEQWFDGANGEGPNGKKQVYNWEKFHSVVRNHNPHSIMFSDVGPDCRWVGNESGIAGKTNWSRLDTEGFTPGAGSPKTDTLNTGNVHGAAWIPAETDVSIRPGWFWRESENDRVKSLDRLLSIYYTSVGRNSLLLLNVPPDNRGLIHQADSTRLVEFKAALDRIFSRDIASGSKVTASATRGRAFVAKNMLDGDYDSFWTVPDGCLTPSFTVTFPEERTFNRVMLQEYIPLGQRVAAFKVEALTPDGNWKEIASATTIGYKRILLTENTTATAVRVTVTKSYAEPVLNGFSLYQDDILKEFRDGESRH